MFLSDFTFDEFVEHAKGKSIQEIIALAREESRRALSMSFGVKGAVKNREMGSVRYAERLKKATFFLGHPGTNGPTLGLSHESFKILFGIE